MTNEKMASTLIAAGWRVKPPLTQETCEHPSHMTIGSGQISSDGSSSMTGHCRMCGKSWSHSTPPNPNRQQLSVGTDGN